MYAVHVWMGVLFKKIHRSCSICFTFLFFPLSFPYLFERECPYLLVHSLNGHSGEREQGLKPGVRNSTQASPMGGWDPST